MADTHFKISWGRKLHVYITPLSNVT